MRAKFRTGRAGCIALLLAFACSASRVLAECPLSASLGVTGVTPTGDGPRQVTVGDFDGDGLAEIAVCETGAGAVAVYTPSMYPSAGAAWGFIRWFAVTGLDRPQQSVTGDFNADGVPDLAIATLGVDGVAIALGTRSIAGPGWSTPTFLPGTSGARAVAAGDLNRDGRLDLAVSCNAGVIVLLGLGTGASGNGQFATPLATAATTPWDCIAMGDLNRDGGLDLIGCTAAPNAIKSMMAITINGGPIGTFGPQSSLVGQAIALSLQLVDMNGDGSLDVVLPGLDGGIAVGVNATPNFSSPLQLVLNTVGGQAGFPPVTAFGAVDLDRDGIRDLVFARGTTGALRLLKGQTDGGYYTINTTDLTMIAAPGGMAFGDFDRDGLVDVAMVSSGSNQIALKRGLCSGAPAGQGYVSARAIGPGAITVSPAGAYQPLGSLVTLQATPLPGATFLGWSGDLSSSASSASMTITGTQSIVGWFARNTHDLSVAVDGDGRVSRSLDLAHYPDSAVVMLVAEPGVRQRFVGWTGDVVSSALGATLLLTADRSVVAHFAPVLFNVTTSIDASGFPGSVVLDPPGGSYVYGTVVSATGVPGIGSEFGAWDWGDHWEFSNPTTFTVTRDMSVTAFFNAAQYDVIVSVSGFGEAYAWLWGQAHYGDTVWLEATPFEGYYFAGWSGDVVDTSSRVSTTVLGPVHVTATFSPQAGFRPVIASVRDVALDQGGYCKLNWLASTLDDVTSSTPGPIGSYYVWRAVPNEDAVAALANGSAQWEGDSAHATAAAPAKAARMLRHMQINGVGSYWEFVCVTPATGLPGYSKVIPTQRDSTPGDPAMQAVFVQARATAGGIWWNSEPSSGHSIDNLAPPAPADGTILWFPGEYELRWSASLAADLVGYRVYQASTPGNSVGPDALVVQTVEPRVRLPRIGGGGGVPATRVRAVDVHGNESAALEFALPILDVESVELAFGLQGLRPNPCRGPLEVEFALQGDAPAELSVLDVSGRVVSREHIPASATAGRRSHHLQLGDAHAAGLYFVRLTQGGRAATARVVLVP